MSVRPSRWGRLADRRAVELLGASAVAPTLVVAAPSGFPAPSGVDIVVAAPGGWSPREGGVAVSASALAGSAMGNGRAKRAGSRRAATAAPPSRGAVAGASAWLPFRDGVFAAVVDTVRPEAAWDDDARVAELVRVCRPGGTLALVACPGSADAGVRTWDAVRARLVAAGCEVVRAVPFDLLGLSSPWRRRLRGRAERVIAELEAHLAFPEVRRAVRMLEREIVAALPLAEAGAVAVLARRGGAADRTVEPAPAPALAAVRATRAFGDAVLRLLRDDAVVRFAAFLDAEVLSTLGVPFDLAGYVEAICADPTRAPAALAALLPRRRWWSTSFDVQRLLAAASHRMAHRAIELLGALPGASRAGVSLPATLEYDLIATLNRALERPAVEPAA